jgi:anti-sigma regulatory factor (Ser/Thr protein kinase)
LTTTELTVRFAGGPYAAASARRALGGLRELVGPERLDDLCLLVSELVTNGVRHAGVGEADELELRVVRRNAHTLRVEVTDPGPGFTRAAVFARGDENGGWGLYLVDQLASEWGVARSDGRNLVWFEVPVDATEGSPGAGGAVAWAVVA